METLKIFLTIYFFFFSIRAFSQSTFSCKLKINLHYKEGLDQVFVNKNFINEYELQIKDNTDKERIEERINTRVQEILDTLAIIGGAQERVKAYLGKVQTVESFISKRKKYILINSNLAFDLLYKSEIELQFLTGLLAHELSHHILNHTSSQDVSREKSMKFELAADSLAGRICYNLFVNFTNRSYQSPSKLENTNFITYLLVLSIKDSDIDVNGFNLRLFAFKRGFCQPKETALVDNTPSSN